MRVDASAPSRVAEDLLLVLLEHWRGAGAVVLPSPELALPDSLMSPDLLLGSDHSASVQVQTIARLPGRTRLLGGRPASELVCQAILRPVPERGLLVEVIEVLEKTGLCQSGMDVRLEDLALELPSHDIRARGHRLRVNGLNLGRLAIVDRLAGLGSGAVLAEVVLRLESLARLCQGAATLAELQWAPDTSWQAVRGDADADLRGYHAAVVGEARFMELARATLEDAELALDAGAVHLAYRRLLEAYRDLSLLEAPGLGSSPVPEAPADAVRELLLRIVAEARRRREKAGSR